MSFNLNPRCIAVEGVGFGTRALAVLGFKWFSIDVIPHTPAVYGGGGVVDTPAQPAKLIISIKINGKWVKREYLVKDYLYPLLSSIVVRYINPLSVVVGNISQKVAQVFTKVKSISVDTVKPTITVKEKMPEITIRRKK